MRSKAGGRTSKMEMAKKVRKGKKRVPRQMAETEEEEEDRIYLSSWLLGEKTLVGAMGDRWHRFREIPCVKSRPKLKKRHTHDWAQNKKNNPPIVFILKTLNCIKKTW